MRGDRGNPATAWGWRPLIVLFCPLCESLCVSFNQRCVSAGQHTPNKDITRSIKIHYTKRDIFMPPEKQKTIREDMRGQDLFLSLTSTDGVWKELMIKQNGQSSAVKWTTVDCSAEWPVSPKHTQIKQSSHMLSVRLRIIKSLRPVNKTKTSLGQLRAAFNVHK